MSNDDLDALITRLNRLNPEERANLAAHLTGQSAVPSASAPAGPSVAGDAEVVQQVTVSADGRINGVIVGTNLGTIIFGRDPSEDERRRLVWYLDRLAATLVQLPLRGLEERLDQGRGVAMPHIYTDLALEGFVPVEGDPRPCFERDDPRRPLKRQYDPAWALPGQARYVNHLPEAADPALPQLARQRRAAEALATNARLVVLGDPGSGKSTLLRYLAWMLARRGLDHIAPTTSLAWDTTPLRLPLLLSLRALAGRMANEGASPATVYAALRDTCHNCNLDTVDDLLNAALHHGAALLLCDGLDEVPSDAHAGQVVDRATVATTLRAFAHQHQHARLVLTCRTRAFDPQLRVLLGWPVETLAPFTLGQIRHFVPAWYGELAAAGQIASSQVEPLSTRLVATIVASPPLQAMACTPLLLTMMALVLYNRGELPRDRPQLYERVLELLLGQWERAGKEGQSLFEAVGLPGWGSERIRPLLDQLSYTAHRDATSADGRGRIERGALYLALLDFFAQARVPQPGEAAHRTLTYIEQRSGLLLADGTASYVFAHLTLQEHCAGRFIAFHEEHDPVAWALQHRAGDRWREPLMLGAGLLRPTELNALLADLIDQEEAGMPKDQARWYRDLILAAEIGVDRDWDYLRTRPAVKVERLQRDLRTGLAALLADLAQPLPLAERLRAGQLLGDLDDPRFPVKPEQWRDELRRWNERFGQPDGYFCYVPAGTYRIGGWKKGEESASITLPAFWIARFPVTVAQYAPFVAQGYKAPLFWTREDYNGDNQPVVTVSWRDATAFCDWLTEQLHAALPPGYVIRLPTEAEWEVAAAYNAEGRRRSYPWGDQEPNPELAIYDEAQVGRPAPVGCCPAGAAACGALDMAGNVWEVTTSDYQNYPQQSGVVQKVFTGDRVPWRGGSWGSSSSNVHCSARVRYHYGFRDVDGLGFRVVAAPLLAHMS